MILFLSCSPAVLDTSIHSDLSFSVEAEVSSLIPTVVTLYIESEQEGTIIASTTINDTFLQTKPVYVPSEGSVSFPFLGIPEDTTALLDIEFISEEQSNMNITVQTGSLPIPPPSIEAIPYTQENMGYMMGTIFGPSERLVILNHQGQVVWQTRQYSDAHGGIDSRIAMDGRSVYFNRFAKDKGTDDGAIHQLEWDGTPIRTIPIPLGHHVFTELPDGTITYIALDPQDTQEYGPVCGDAIIEISPDGTQTEIFTTWGNIPLYESDFFNAEFYPQGHDWTHTNFVEYFPETERYLISMASTNMIVELDRQGNVYKKIGGQGARGFDYSVQNPGDIFAYPHAPQWNHKGELLVMSTLGINSQVIAYSINEESKSLTKEWSYGSDYNYNVLHLGEFSQNEEENFINWSTVGHMELQNPQNEITWEAFSPFGLWFAQFNHLEALPGMEPPQ